jgi:glutathione S-transferase
MAELILNTFDWVPEAPRGFVRDIRVRWALEEAGLPYRVESTPFKKKVCETEWPLNRGYFPFET